MQRPRTSNRPGLFGAIFLIAALLLPIASAASFPVLGEWEWRSLGGFLVIMAIVGFAVVVGLGILLGWIPVIGKVFRDRRVGFGMLTVGLLFAMVVNPGAVFHGAGSPAAAADLSSSWDAELYEATSDVTFYVADDATRSTLNAAIKVYKPGVTAKAAFEGTATAEYSGTASSGTLTFNGIQTQTLGCTVDVALDLADYYEKLVTGVNICVQKNLLGNNDISVPTLYMDKIGTLSLSKSDTTHTCALSTSCDYTVILQNTAVDTKLQDVAIKFAAGDGDETLNSASTGCEIVEVNQVKYIKPTNGNIGSLGTVTCVISVGYTAAAGQTFNLTADDHWQVYGATTWNTHAGVRGASATSAVEVSRA